MTVTYTHEVANARFCGFSRLLGRWKGSIYKIFYKEFIVFVGLYSLISIVYRYALMNEKKRTFEKIVLEFHNYTELIPIAYVLGFYVTLVVGRWWQQLMNLPFPDKVMFLVTSNVHGADDRGRIIRRTLLRYLNLSQLITYQAISTATRKRFPTIEHFVFTGMMSANEYEEFKQVKSKHLKYWVPLVWFSNLLSKAKLEGRVFNDISYNHIMQEMITFRNCLGELLCHDWVTLPLVYTQVVTLAVYTYFGSTLIGRQYLDPDMNYQRHQIDLYIPYFTICEFLFYMGLLKVAEELINPLGEDDDDFDLNEVIDRNCEVPMIAVDYMYGSHPKLKKDHFWDIENPEVPYPDKMKSKEPFRGSTVEMRSPDKHNNVPMTSQPKFRNVSLSSRRINRSERHLKDIRNNSPLEIVDENGNNLFMNRSVRQMSNFNLYSHMSEADSQKVGLLPSNYEDEEETVDANSSEEEDQVNDVDSIPSEEDEKHLKADKSEEKSDGGETSSKLPILVKEVEKDIQENVEKATMPKIEIKKKITTPLVKNSTGNNKSNRRMTRNQRDEVFQQRLKLHIPTTEDDSELENLHKRIQMQTKNKKIQKGQNEVKRLQRSKLLYSVGSPDHDSTPYGSLASFATSVPSPRPLRWAFQQNKTSDRYLSGQSSAFSLFSQDYNPLEQRYNPLEQRYNRNISHKLSIDHSKPVTLKNLPNPSSSQESKLPKITFIAPTVTGKLHSSQRAATKRTVWSSIRAWFTEFNRRYEGRAAAQKLMQERRGSVFSPTFNEEVSFNSLLQNETESRPVLIQPTKESSSVVWVDETNAENKKAKGTDENRPIEINAEIREDIKTDKITSNEQLNRIGNNSSNNIIINTEQADRKAESFASVVNLSNTTINSDKPDETNFSLLLPIPECGPLTTTDEVPPSPRIQISSASPV